MASYARITPQKSVYKNAINWWPVGTSLTQGVAGGYRRWLFQAMQALGKSPATVGGLNTVDYGGDPALCGTKHNGNAGSTVANWVSTYFAMYVGSAVGANLVTIELGMNDADSGASGDAVGGDMVDLTAAAFPMASILVFTVPARSGVALDTMNAAIIAAVNARRARGIDVSVVDLRTQYIPRLDGVHPTLDGYKIMGDLIAPAVMGLVA